MNPFRDSTDIVDDADRLRARAEQDGYLFIRGLLPAANLERVRLSFLEVLRDEGYADADGYRDQLINPANIPADRGSIPNETYRRLYLIEPFHALQHEPALLRVMEALLETPVLAHPSIISRVVFPQREMYTTPAHQDFVHVQGASDTYTAWFPLHDLPASMGGLTVAAGSHRRGIYDYRPALGAGGMAVIDPLEGTWATSEFRQGDVLIFHSFAVHKALPLTGDRLRLSVDGRYQSARDPVLTQSLKPHLGMATWAEVYAGWPSGGLQYYWTGLQLDHRQRDGVFRDRVDNQTLEELEAGSLSTELRSKASGAMERIMAREDAARRDRAAAMLAQLTASDDS